jgi:hypothetical protein
MALSAAQKAVIANASRPAVEFGLRKSRLHWRNNRWLSLNNMYARKHDVQIETDSDAGDRFHHLHLSQYIAASTIAHCSDGWSYFSRALDSLLRGDLGAATHLAYYAELRAAMSFLASNGIGVFNSRHVALDASRNGKTAGKCGTHAFVWEALQVWADQPSAAAGLFDVIAPGGIALSEWLKHFSAGTVFQAGLAKTWLKGWGMDLQQFVADRGLRNFVSYRPTSYVASDAVTLDSTMKALNQMWSLSEPIGRRAFHLLDRELLRISLLKCFQLTHGRTRRQSRSRFSSQIDRMMHGMSAPADMNEDQWKQFLNSEGADELPPLLRDAQGSDGPESNSHPRQVLARAFLLLRVATGFCQQAIIALNVNRTETEFWWQTVGLDRGLWATGNAPEEFFDLWSDIAIALGDSRDWLDAADAADVSYHAFWQQCAHSAITLGTSERIGLWGLGL